MKTSITRACAAAIAAALMLSTVPALHAWGMDDTRVITAAWTAGRKPALPTTRNQTPARIRR